MKTYTEQEIRDIARVCHDANKAWCEANGDFSQLSWNEAEQWQKDSAIAGVRYALENPDSTPEDQHNAWSRDKIEQGWVYGAVKDTVAKTHPCLVFYSELPEFQRKKDALFRNIVNSLK